MIRDNFSKILREAMSEDSWVISEDQYDVKKNLQFESLFALSNGYMGIRGVQEEGNHPSLPYVYINGIFDKSETFMRELVTLPNWSELKFYVEKQLLSVERCAILEYRRALDLKTATLYKHVLLRDESGRESLIESVRFLSRENVHRMGLKVYFTPLNYDGILEIESSINGSILNFCDAPRFKVKHSVVTENSAKEDNIYLEVETRDDLLHIGTGASLYAYENGEEVLRNRRCSAFGEVALEFADCKVEAGKTVEILKYVSVFTEKDCERASIPTSVCKELKSFRDRGFTEEHRAHKKVYDTMWKRANVRIKGDFELDRAVRFNIFHLMSTASEYDDRVNVGAKLLSGEEYGGHAFWDTELFMLPFFSFVFPEKARRLERYRYRLLDAARKNARKNGYLGAQYPWESADDGTEQCPDWTIEPDGSCYRCYVAKYEHHVTAAVMYGAYKYAETTGDTDFLYKEAAEIFVETARFWASRVLYNETLKLYEIREVTGPDEWHEPVNNNVYTNYLVKWCLRFVSSLITEMRDSREKEYQSLCEKLHFTEKEVETWREISDKIYIPKKEGTKIFEQFEGYFDLYEVLIEKYDKNDWPVRPEILKRKSIPETQLIKQADVVMLMYLLGQEFDEETIRENYNYYEKRTLHGSSLSPSIYAIMGLKIGDSSKAYRYLRRAALLDLWNIQGNTREGIHAANTGGVWQTVVFGFAGLSLDENGELHLQPHMPKEWEELQFSIMHRGEATEITIKGDNSYTIRKREENEV